MLDIGEIRKISKIFDIGRATGLYEERLYLFAAYVFHRFPDSAKSYHEEWAFRFATGQEYERSDLHGQAVLKELAPIFYGHENSLQNST